MPELGSNLEDDDLRLRLGEELLDVFEDDVDAVGEEDSMADLAVLLYTDVDDPGASDQLLVDGQGLALSKRASYEWESNLVGSRVMGSRPYDLVDVNVLWVKTSHPILSIRRPVIRAREILATASIEITESLLFC